MIPKPTTFMCLCGMFQFQEQASLWSQLLKFVIMLHNNFTHGERLCVGAWAGEETHWARFRPSLPSIGTSATSDCSHNC